MTDRADQTLPLSKPIVLLMLALLLTAFVSHRERALLLMDRGDDYVMLTDALAASSFAPPGGWGDDLRSRLAQRWGDWVPAGLPRSRQGPRRGLPGNDPAPAIPQSAQSSTFPVASAVGPVGPLINGPSGGNAGGGTVGGPSGSPGGGGLLPPFPSGGGGGGGGGSISGGLVPPVPPSAVIPEPAVWAMMILGFGLAGYQLRRRRLPSMQI